TQRETIPCSRSWSSSEDIVNVKDSGTQMTPDQEDPTPLGLDRINTAANTMDSYQRRGCRRRAGWLRWSAGWRAGGHALRPTHAHAEAECYQGGPLFPPDNLDLVNELDQHQPAVEETTRLGEQFIQQAQDYDSQLEQFRSSLNSDLSDAAKKPKIQSSADIVGQQLDDLNRRYRDLVAKTTRNLQLMNSSLAAEEKQKEGDSPMPLSPEIEDRKSKPNLPILAVEEEEMQLDDEEQDISELTKPLFDTATVGKRRPSIKSKAEKDERTKLMYANIDTLETLRLETVKVEEIAEKEKTKWSCEATSQGRERTSKGEKDIKLESPVTEAVTDMDISEIEQKDFTQENVQEIGQAVPKETEQQNVETVRKDKEAKMEGPTGDIEEATEMEVSETEGLVSPDVVSGTVKDGKKLSLRLVNRVGKVPH
ncbi:hypothetical protein Bbelb_446620, partial [Branchiostoma belcheri]